MVGPTGRLQWPSPGAPSRGKKKLIIAMAATFWMPVRCAASLVLSVAWPVQLQHPLASHALAHPAFHPRVGLNPPTLTVSTSCSPAGRGWLACGSFLYYTQDGGSSWEGLSPHGCYRTYDDSPYYACQSNIYTDIAGVAWMGGRAVVTYGIGQKIPHYAYTAVRVPECACCLHPLRILPAAPPPLQPCCFC